MGLVGWIVIGVVVLLLFWGVAIYNGLVRLRALVREGFSGITVQLRRRADLIPNLVRPCRAMRRMSARCSIRSPRIAPTPRRPAASPPPPRPTPPSPGMLGRLMVVAEAYPDLKADANFRQLQEELSEIEEHLQSARRYYNATVRDLNTKIQSFPNVMIAGPMGFSEEESYQDADASIQSAPKVSFGAAKA